MYWCVTRLPSPGCSPPQPHHAQPHTTSAAHPATALVAGQARVQGGLWEPQQPPHQVLDPSSSSSGSPAPHPGTLATNRDVNHVCQHRTSGQDAHRDAKHQGQQQQQHSHPGDVSGCWEDEDERECALLEFVNALLEQYVKMVSGVRIGLDTTSHLGLWQACLKG